MAKYAARHFNPGERVYHTSNSNFMMVTIKIDVDKNEITCRWVDKDGQVRSTIFMAEELGKAKDLGPEVNFS